MKLDATKYNPDPAYLRELIKKAGISQREAGRLIGVEARLFRGYLADRGNVFVPEAPYSVQFCLECLAANRELK